MEATGLEGISNNCIQVPAVGESSSTGEVLSQHPILVYRLRIPAKDIVDSINLPVELSTPLGTNDSSATLMSESQNALSNGSGQIELMEKFQCNTNVSECSFKLAENSLLDSSYPEDMGNMDQHNPQQFLVGSALMTHAQCKSFRRDDTLPNLFTDADTFNISTELNPRRTNEVRLKTPRGKAGPPNRRTRLTPMQLLQPHRPYRPQYPMLRLPFLGAPMLPPRMSSPNPWLIKRVMQCSCLVCQPGQFLDPRMSGMDPIGSQRMPFNGFNTNMGNGPAAVSTGWPNSNGFGAAPALSYSSLAWDLSRRSSDGGNSFPLAQLVQIPPPPRYDALFPFAFSQGKWIVAQFRCELCGKLEATSWGMHCHRWDHPDEKLKYMEINLTTGLPTMIHECPYIPAMESKLATKKPKA